MTFNKDQNLLEQYLNDSLIFDKRTMFPDGGMLFIELNGSKLPILCSEKKNQGQHDKGKDSYGNAHERASKNINLFSDFVCSLKVNPYIVYIDGFACKENYRMNKDFIVMMQGAKPNEYNVEKKYGNDYLSKGSFFSKVDQFSIDEMVEIGYNVSKIALEAYNV